MVCQVDWRAIGDETIFAGVLRIFRKHTTAKVVRRVSDMTMDIRVRKCIFLLLQIK